MEIVIEPIKLGIGFLVTVFFFAMGIYNWNLKRLIELTPTSKIRSLAMGRVEVYGSVSSVKGQALRTPFSNKECVYCRWVVEMFVQRRRNRKWVPLASGFLSSNFTIDDGTGKVLVDPKGAAVDVTNHYETSAISPNLVSFLESQGISSSLLSNNQVKLSEDFIGTGEKVYIMGSAGDNPFVKEGTGTKNVTDIMIHASGSPYYYITNKPKKEILNKCARYALVGIICGCVALLGTIAFFFWQSNLL